MLNLVQFRHKRSTRISGVIFSVFNEDASARFYKTEKPYPKAGYSAKRSLQNHTTALDFVVPDPYA